MKLVQATVHKKRPFFSLVPRPPSNARKVGEEYSRAGELVSVEFRCDDDDADPVICQTGRISLSVAGC